MKGVIRQRIADRYRKTTHCNRGIKVQTGLTIIGGFLGAGKTTLLNHLLNASNGRRLAIIVNDFGAVNIDEKLIVGNADSIISLANGCVCCEFGPNIYVTLLKLLKSASPPDAVLIETSGVADPGKLAQIGQIGQFLKLRAIAVVVDAAHIQTHAQDPYLEDTILRQIRAADVLIVNKSDLVSTDALSGLNAWLDEISPGVPRLEAVAGKVPPEVILDDLAHGCVKGIDFSSWHLGADRAHSLQFVSWHFHVDRIFSLEKLRKAFDLLPPWILRAKGIVFTDEAPNRQVVVQKVAGWIDYGGVGPRVCDPRESHIIFISLRTQESFEPYLKLFANAVT
ncbi:CobW family GTP-binding protein [Caballeronia sordidicola]|uniref:CobW family GTP-binding protein n=1 Tax=Caballeronia sordidicola TaxID=196367 RepID=UPI000B78BF3C|nr:GTP-binding protein [Caballeronia sordidicola]